MNEISISKFTAANIVKDYYEDYYSNIVNIKVIPKLVNNDLLMVVKKNSKLNGTTISLTDIINEGQISSIIKEHMKKNNCEIESIMYEPYFHNLNIRYSGEFKLKENKKVFIKLRGAV